MGALRGDAPVHRQRSEKGHEHQDQGRYRGQGCGGECGDARLVPEGREVIDAGQAHDLPPGVLVGAVLRCVRTLEILRSIVEEPAADSAVWRTHLLWSHPDGCTRVHWHSVPHDEPLLRRAELRIRLSASASFEGDG